MGGPWRCMHHDDKGRRCGLARVAQSGGFCYEHLQDKVRKTAEKYKNKITLRSIPVPHEYDPGSVAVRHSVEDSMEIVIKAMNNALEGKIAPDVLVAVAKGLDSMCSVYDCEIKRKGLIVTRRMAQAKLRGLIPGKTIEGQRGRGTGKYGAKDIAAQFQEIASIKNALATGQNEAGDTEGSGSPRIEGPGVERGVPRDHVEGGEPPLPDEAARAEGTLRPGDGVEAEPPDGDGPGGGELPPSIGEVFHDGHDGDREGAEAP